MSALCERCIKQSSHLVTLRHILEKHKAITVENFAQKNTAAYGFDGQFFALIDRIIDAYFKEEWTPNQDELEVFIGKTSQVFQWFSDSWPADLAWPSDIPRPALVSPSSPQDVVGAP